MKLIEDDLEQSDDGELFALIAKNNTDSEKAFDVFYKRYKNDFYRLLFRISSDERVKKELFNETMERAYYKAHTFKVENNKIVKNQRGKTLAWLGKIARNIYIQTFRDNEKEVKAEVNEDLLETVSENGIISKAELNSKIRESEDNFFDIKNSATNSISSEKKILQKVLLELSERDRDILLAYYDEYDPRIKHQKLSRGKIKELSQRYNITPDYIRTLKGRIFKNVSKKCLNQMAEKVESKI